MAIRNFNHSSAGSLKEAAALCAAHRGKTAFIAGGTDLVQGILMVLLIALPLTAITGAWLEGHPLTLLGGIEIPPALGTAHDLGKTIANIHGWLGDAVIWIAGGHAVAAIYHHFYRKDDILVLMLPHWLTARLLRR